LEDKEVDECSHVEGDRVAQGRRLKRKGSPLRDSVDATPEILTNSEKVSRREVPICIVRSESHFGTTSKKEFGK